MHTLNAIHFHMKDRKVFLVFDDEEGHVIHKPLFGPDAEAFLDANAEALASLSRAAISVITPVAVPDEVPAPVEPEPLPEPEPAVEPAVEPEPEPDSKPASRPKVVIRQPKG